MERHSAHSTRDLGSSFTQRLMSSREETKQNKESIKNSGNE